MRNLFLQFYFFKSFNQFRLFSFLIVLDLHCRTRAFSSCGEWELLSVMVWGPLAAAAPLLVEHGFWVQRLQWLQLVGSRVQASVLQGILSSQPRHRTHFSCIGRHILTHCTTRKVHQSFFFFNWSIVDLQCCVHFDFNEQFLYWIELPPVWYIYYNRINGHSGVAFELCVHCVLIYWTTDLCISVPASNCFD